MDEATEKLEDAQSTHSSTAALDSSWEPDTNVYLAAAHIEDAKFGRGRFGKAYVFFKSRFHKLCFGIVSNKWFKRLFHFAVILHSVSAYLEPPSSPVGSRQYFSAVVLCLLSLPIYLVDIILTIISVSCKGFFTFDEFTLNRVELVLFCFFTFDFMLLIVQSRIQLPLTIQPFRALRAAMILTKSKDIFHVFRVILSIMWKFGLVILVALLFILLYACAGVHVLMPHYQNITSSQILALSTVQRVLNISNGTEVDTSVISPNPIYEGVFNHIGKALVQLFVLLTTENYPVFMFPAFAVTKSSFVYFSTFIFAGAFLLTAIQLAIIADTYWDYHKRRAKEEKGKARAELVKAWKLLEPLGNESLSIDDPQLLMLFKILKPNNSKEENFELIRELDPNDTGEVDWLIWVTELLTILNLEKAHHTKHSQPQNGLLKCQAVVQKAAAKITEWKYFHKIILVLILLHSILFAVKWSGMPAIAEIIIQIIKTAITLIFLLEVLLRIAAVGRSFFRNTLDVLDSLLVIFAVVTNLLWYGSSRAPDQFYLILWRALSVICSCGAIFCRLFFKSNLSHKLLLLFLKLFPIMLDLVVLFLIAVYFYAVIGMDALGRFEVKPGDRFEQYFLYDCGLGFEDMRCSMFMVFQIAMANNWNEIMNAVVVDLNNYAPIIYFISCYMILNILITNVLAAIVIEAYNKFSESSAEGIEDCPNKYSQDWRSLLMKFVSETRNFFRPTTEEIEDEQTIMSRSVSRLTMPQPYSMPSAFSSQEVFPLDASNESVTEGYNKITTSAASTDKGPEPSSHLSQVGVDEGACVSPVEKCDEIPSTLKQKDWLKQKEKMASELREKTKLKNRMSQETLADREAATTSPPPALAWLNQQEAQNEIEAGDIPKHKVMPVQISVDEPPHDTTSEEMGKSNNDEVIHGPVAHVTLKNARPLPSMLSLSPSVQSWSESRKKFRQGFRSNNWSVDVMQATIISPKEVDELRKQLGQLNGHEARKQKSIADFVSKYPPRTRLFKKKVPSSMKFSNGHQIVHQDSAQSFQHILKDIHEERATKMHTKSTSISSIELVDEASVAMPGLLLTPEKKAQDNEETNSPSEAPV